MGAPMKCKGCGARWYGMGSQFCMDCGSENIDVDFTIYLREQYKDHKRACKKAGSPPPPYKDWKADYLRKAEQR